MNTKMFSVTVLILFFSLPQRAIAHDTDPAVPLPAELGNPVLPAAAEVTTSDRPSVLQLKPQTFATLRSSDARQDLADNFAAVSIYQTFWSASAGVAQYGLYVKGLQEPAYRYTDSTTATTAYIYTNIPGDGRVSACNVNGCSGLSVDRVVVSHQPQCGG